MSSFDDYGPTRKTGSSRREPRGGRMESSYINVQSGEENLNKKMSDMDYNPNGINKRLSVI